MLCAAIDVSPIVCPDFVAMPLGGHGSFGVIWSTGSGEGQLAVFIDVNTVWRSSGAEKPPEGITARRYAEA